MSEPTIYLGGRVSVHAGDCLATIKALADNSIDACVCDPPYALVSVTKRYSSLNAKPCGAGTDGSFRRLSRGFMGKAWDNGSRAFAVDFWAEVWRVLKPGAHVVAFCGTRSYHRLACAIEDAGFEIRDQIGWCYATGFPKSHDVSKGIDKAAGATREVVGPPSYSRGKTSQSYSETRKVSYDCDPLPITKPATDDACTWEGWGTALKPAWEPICLARKPLSEATVAANCLRWGTGALNIDACRVSTVGEEITPNVRDPRRNNEGWVRPWMDDQSKVADGQLAAYERMKSLGRWPANLVHDGSPEVLAAFPETTSGTFSGHRNEPKTNGVYGKFELQDERGHIGDSGSAARFFFSAKADADDRLGSKHPTVKPLALMQWLCKLVCPTGGTVLDPFAGTGTTGEAAWREGFNAVLCEREAEYLADIARRMKLCLAGPDERGRESIKARNAGKPDDHGPLFGPVMRDAE